MAEGIGPEKVNVGILQIILVLLSERISHSSSPTFTVLPEALKSIPLISRFSPPPASSGEKVVSILESRV